MAQQGRQPQQLHRIEIAAWIPGILHVVAAHGHPHAGGLQLLDRGLGAHQWCGSLPLAEQPEIGEWQGHHRHPGGGQAVGPSGQLRRRQQGQAAGVAAGDRHPAAAAPLQQPHQRPHPGSGGGIVFIDVKIEAAAQGLGLRQQGLQTHRIPGQRGEGGSHHAAQQAPIARHPSGQQVPIGRAPVPQRRQGHQLQIHPAGPARPELLQRLPDLQGRRGLAVDMAAERPQTMAPGSLQRQAGSLQHLLAAALAQFPQIGLQGSSHGAGGIGKEGSAEGLVEVHVGIDRRREGQGQLPRGRQLHRMEGRDPALGMLDPHRGQAIPIGRWQGSHGVEQTTGDPQRPEPVHRTVGSAVAWLLRRMKKRPAPAKVMAL